MIKVPARKSYIFGDFDASLGGRRQVIVFFNVVC